MTEIPLRHNINMKDSPKTKKQLIEELQEARQRLDALEAPEAERQQAEEALRESEEKYRTLVDNSIIGIVNVDLSGKITYVNKTILQSTGYSRDELVGKNGFSIGLIPPDTIKVLRKRMKEKLLGQPPGRLEIQFKRKDGVWIWLQLRGSLLRIRNIPVGIQIVGEDITEYKRAEEALRESEEKFYKAFHSSPQAIIITTLKDGRFIEVNDSHQRITGHSHKELIGRTSADIDAWVYPGDRRRVIKTLKEKGRINNEEIEFRKKSGETYTGLFSAELINIGGEKCIISSVLDITNRKQMEEALANEAIRRRILVDESLDGIVVLNENAGVIEANQRFAEMLGYSPDEVRELHTWDWDTQWSREELLEMGRNVDAKGLRLETRHRCKDGTFIDVDISINGAVVVGQKLIFCVCRDVTKRKEMEEALRESEEKFSKAFRSSPVFFVITRLSDGTFLDVNDSFTRATGYTHEELIGNSSLEMGIWGKPGDREKMLKLLKKNGRVSNEEYELRTKSGEVRTMLFSAEQIILGQELCLLCVSTDITEYRQMEAQAREAEYLRELDRLRTELLANISHELRTPLAGIKGFATMLLDYEDRLKHHEKREYLQTIDKNTDRLVELIEQLLEMSRLEAGMLSINLKPASILKLCRDTIHEVRIRSTTHEFTLDVPPKLPRANVDARRIRQVLDNIIDNSLKYSEAGTEINLAVRPEGRELLFTVTDHGAGIPPHDLPRVFNRMFRSSRKPGVAGAGLGLSICKGLVVAHGGRIWIESEEGQGTRCFFTLPLDNGKGKPT